MRGQAATLDGMRVDTFYIFFKSFWDLGASRVTGSVFHNLHEKKKKILQLYVEKPLSSCLS